MKRLEWCIAIGSLLMISCQDSIDIPIQDFDQQFYPTGKNIEVIKHKYYTLSYSEPDEQAEWVAYLLTSKMANGSVERKDNFRVDPLVSTGSANSADYVGSNHDKGHLCPAADMSFSEEAMSETFFMSNMSPQVSSFNRGIWKVLEDQVREWSSEYDSIYVITGPVLTSKKGTIGANEVTIPKYYYKVLMDYCQPEIKMIAFILPNEKGIGTIRDYVVTTDSVEILTGIDFFPSLPDDQEKQIESIKKPELWRFK